MLCTGKEEFTVLERGCLPKNNFLALQGICVHGVGSGYLPFGFLSGLISTLSRQLFYEILRNHR